MMTALNDLSVYQAAYALTDADLLATADVNGDGVISNHDIQPLINAIIAAASQSAASNVAASPSTPTIATPTTSESSDSIATDGSEIAMPSAIHHSPLTLPAISNSSAADRRSSNSAAREFRGEALQAIDLPAGLKPFSRAVDDAIGSALAYRRHAQWNRATDDAFAADFLGTDSPAGKLRIG
jgi:hypothetical protein